MSIPYINSLRPSVTKLGFHADWARLVLFSEFSFKRSVVSGPEFFVLRVFFSKDLWFPSSAFKPTGPGPSVGISYSQSFLLKDLCYAVATLEL
jgi:hypothetical protein